MRRSRLRSRDLIGEAIAGILQRTGRTVLTVVGIVLGVAAFVAVLGITATATGQISQHFTELASTEVTAEDLTVTEPDTEQTAFPPDSDERARAINGVRHAGVYWFVPSDRAVVTGVPLPGVAANLQLPVVATSPGLFDAVQATLREGRAFDRALNERAERVVVLGRAAAQQLGVTRLDVRPAIHISDTPFTVVGIVESVQRRPELLAAAWVPRGTAEALWPGPFDTDQPPRMIVDTELGAAQIVAQQVSLALRPDSPDSFRVQAPPDPRQLRDTINTDLSSLFLVLAGLSLLIGAVGIANTTLVAVLERVPEIGLRRSLGAQRRHIAVQFLTESSALGAIGGFVGAGLGVTAVVIVAIAQRWTAIIEPWTVFAAPAVGIVTGLVAGLYPALRASRIEPVEALRQHL